MKVFRKIISLLIMVAMLVGVVSAGSFTASAGKASGVGKINGVECVWTTTEGPDRVDVATVSSFDVTFSGTKLPDYFGTEVKFGVVYPTFDDEFVSGQESITTNVRAYVVSISTAGKSIGNHTAKTESIVSWNGAASNTATATLTIEFWCSHQGKAGAAATCTSTQVCTRCGEKIADKNPNNHSSVQKGSTVTPSCTRQGYTNYSCSGCGVSWTDDFTGPSAHSYAWREVTPATITAAGVEEEYCTVCLGTSGETREIPKIQYTFKKSKDSTAMIDNVRGLLYGISERSSELESYFTLKNCTLQYSTPIGTGTDVKVMVGSELAKELTVIIFGDVTADGVVDAFDVSNINSVVNFETEYDTMALNMAGDVFEDGYIDAIDLAFLISASNMEFFINQRGVVEPGGDEPGQDDPGQDDPVNPNYQYTFMDYQYGSHGERNLMDFSMPYGITGEVGLIMYVHGGSWIAGDKNGYRTAIANMNRAGYAAAAINYRYASATSGFDEMAVDINNALSAIKGLAAENGVTINKVMFYGESAGAHISLMYCYTKASQAPITPVCVRGNASPADLTISRYKSSEATLTEISCMAGTPTKVYKLITPSNVNDDWAQYYLREYSPSYHASTGIPTLLCHGEKDDGVPIQGAINLYAALQLNGIFVDSVIYPNSGHELGFDPDCSALADEKMVDMMETYLPAPNLPKQ